MDLDQHQLDQVHQSLSEIDHVRTLLRRYSEGGYLLPSSADMGVLADKLVFAAGDIRKHLPAPKCSATTTIRCDLNPGHTGPHSWIGKHATVEWSDA